MLELSITIGSQDVSVDKFLGMEEGPNDVPVCRGTEIEQFRTASRSNMTLTLSQIHVR